MDRLREEYDADWQASVTNSGEFKTKINKYQLRCSLCKKISFVDDVTFKQVIHAIEADPTNNPFVCEHCGIEIDYFFTAASGNI